MTSDSPKRNLTSSGYAVEIVAAYVSKNHVARSDLPQLLATVHGALANLATGHGREAPQAELPSPTQIRRSITRDALISFIDGKGYKSLKRHLTSRGFTPKSYRARYGLPIDYPMVASSYSERRSTISRELGARLRERDAVKGGKPSLPIVVDRGVPVPNGAKPPARRATSSKRRPRSV